MAWLTVPLMRSIYYGPEEAYSGYIAAILERDTKAFQGDPNCRFAVVIDDSLPSETIHNGTSPPPPVEGKVIAGIKYLFIDTPAPSPTGQRSWPPYSNSALADSVWVELDKSRALIASRLGPRVLVDGLYTDPAHHRQGAGSMLMRRACEEADARGLPCMLEASPKGLSVYSAVGFQPFGEGGDDGKGHVYTDLRRWDGGGDKGVALTEERLREDPDRRGGGWYTQVLMVRPAK